jgi:hypothetical protein
MLLSTARKMFGSPSGMGWRFKPEKNLHKYQIMVFVKKNKRLYRTSPF